MLEILISHKSEGSLLETLYGPFQPFFGTFNTHNNLDFVPEINMVEVWLTLVSNKKTCPTQSHPTPPHPRPHPTTSPNLAWLKVYFGCVSFALALRRCCFIFLTVVFMVEPKRMPLKFECSEVNWRSWQWNPCHQRLFIMCWVY